MEIDTEAHTVSLSSCSAVEQIIIRGHLLDRIESAMESCTPSSPASSSSPSQSIGIKQRRITQACDFCHRRGVKCRKAGPNLSRPGESTCLTCLTYGERCTRDRRPKKRGKPRAGSAREPTGGDRHRVHAEAEPSFLARPFETIATFDSDGSMTSPILGNRKVITALLDVYLDTIHPTFPFFCERDIWVCWRDGSFPSSRSDYMSLVCMCALSAHHVRNGALFTDGLPSSESATLAQSYLQEAIRLVPTDFGDFSVNLVRSYGFLALLGSQKGHNAMAHKYLGLYHGICAQYSFHDESKWSFDMGVCEKEVRRRIWWAMYRLEVHTACVLGSIIRCPESQSNVGYPSGIHHPAFIPGRDGQYEDWFSGWNLTTDLYRVLEHAVSEFRAKRRPRPSILQDGTDTVAETTVTTEIVMKRLSKIQDELMPQFGAACPRSSDSGRNRCGFQASNILCTIHLARMILCISEDANLVSVFQMARYMMDKINEIPHEYVRAVGSPLLQKLAGIGHMLVGVARKHQISIEEHGELRAVLVSMIDFLAIFNSCYSNVVTAAQQRLTDQVADLDHRLGTMLTEENAAAQHDFLGFEHERMGQDVWPTQSVSTEISDTEDDGFLSGRMLHSFIEQYLSREGNG